MELRVLSLYPEQMNIYADRGNILFLRRRCEWRGIDFRWDGAGPGEAVDPGAHDLFYIGGGQDRDQRVVAADMVETKRAALASAVDDGAALLAVCGGYQLLGESYQLGEETLPGLGLADLRTVREPGPRLIGNVAIETDLGGEKRLLAGFENHGGRTYLGPGARPLGRVVKGQQRRRRPRGRLARQPPRHLPPRSPAPQERLAGRPPDRAGAGAAVRRAPGTRAAF
jgi:CobQ-like glutamine amidotransferase family enzyme